MRFPAFRPLEPKTILEEKLYLGLNRENLPRIYAALRIDKGATRDLLLRPSLLTAAGLLGLAACLALERFGHRPGLFWLLPTLATLWFGYSALFTWIGTRRIRYLNVSLRELLDAALEEKERGMDFPAFHARYLRDYHPGQVAEGRRAPPGKRETGRAGQQ